MTDDPKKNVFQNIFAGGSNLFSTTANNMPPSNIFSRGKKQRELKENSDDQEDDLSKDLISNNAEDKD